MKAPLLRLILALALGALAGCAGTDFVKPDAQDLSNGRTTFAQVLARMGQPRQQGSVVKNEKTLKTVSYAYASVGGKPLNAGVTPARALVLYFFNDTLVGHEFVSSWAEDNTDFDESRIKDIVKGKTTRAQAQQMVGKPGGSYIYPLVKDPGGEAGVYVYSEVRGFTPYRKVLIVTFDRAGVVSDVEFNSAGSK